MPTAVRLPVDQTKDSIPQMLNDSFDRDFRNIAVELLGYDGTNLTRVKTDSSGNLTGGNDSLNFKTNHLDDYTTTNVTYVGKEKPDGTYWLMKIDETGNFPVYTHASITNNPTLTTYSLAWTGRTTATYGLYSVAF